VPPAWQNWVMTPWKFISPLLQCAPWPIQLEKKAVAVVRLSTLSECPMLVKWDLLNFPPYLCKTEFPPKRVWPGTPKDPPLMFCFPGPILGLFSPKLFFLFSPSPPSVPPAPPDPKLHEPPSNRSGSRVKFHCCPPPPRQTTPSHPQFPPFVRVGRIPTPPAAKVAVGFFVLSYRPFPFLPPGGIQPKPWPRFRPVATFMARTIRCCSPG